MKETENERNGPGIRMDVDVNEWKGGAKVLCTVVRGSNGSPHR